MPLSDNAEITTKIKYETDFEPVRLKQLQLSHYGVDWSYFKHHIMVKSPSASQKHLPSQHFSGRNVLQL